MAVTRRPNGNVDDIGWMPYDGTDQIPWITYVENPVIINAQYYGEDYEQWSDDDLISDQDSWFSIDAAQSKPVVADVITAPTQYIEDAWDWFEEGSVEHVVIPAGYQQREGPDVTPDIWDHWTTDDDDYVVIDDYAIIDVVVAQAQYYGEDSELLDQDDDQIWDLDYQLIENLSPVEDSWDHFTTDDDDYVVIDDYQLIENLSPVEDPIDHWTQDDDDQVIVDDSAPRSDNQLQYFGEDAELADQDDDDQVVVLEFAYVDANPVICLEDPYDHWTTDDDDYVVIDDYAIIENLNPVEDAWDHWVTDDDDQVDIVEFSLISVPLTTLQYYGEDAELLDQDDDDQVYPDTDVLGLTLAQVFDDGWDYFAQDEDDYFVSEDFQNDVSICVEDPYDHWITDDDDYVVSEDFQNDVSICTPDAWDHWLTDDDDQPPLDDVIAPAIVPVICTEDAFDHFTTDDDNYTVVDDYELIDAGTILLVSGTGFSICIAFGNCTTTPQGPFTLDPRSFNGSNAWLGYRGASGLGVW